MATSNGALETISVSQQAKWSRKLAFWVNSVAISNDGGRLAAATFFHDYGPASGVATNQHRFGPNEQGLFGTYCFDSQGQQLWCDEYKGWDGVFAVAISADDRTVAAGGWLDKNTALLRAYDAADGKRLLDCGTIHQRVSAVALSDDGKVLAAAADDVYVFLRSGPAYDPAPLTLGLVGVSNKFLTSVAVHPSGKWLAACDKVGQVYMAEIENGAIKNPRMWKAKQKAPFLSLAISRNSEYFAVGGGDFVYLFDFAAIRKGQDPIAPIECDTRDNDAPAGAPSRLPENVRWVAISGDGKLVTAVANRGRTAATKSGLLIALSRENGQLVPAWHKKLDHNPNSTSINEAAAYVTASDGYPVGKPAKLYLFDGAGTGIWEFDTPDMSWPMVVSAKGAGIAAGDDNGMLYYFEL